MLFNHTINFRELKAVLHHCYRNQRSLMIYGSSGIGKSAYIEAWTKNELHTDLLVDFRLCLEQVESIGGQWIPEDTEANGLAMIKALPEIWLPLLEEGVVGVLFLDELTSASPAKQAIAYQLLHDRKIGGRKISSKVLIVSAGNMLDSGGLVFELLKPVANRVLQVEILGTGEEATKIYIEDFAIPANMNVAVIDYLENKPQNLNKNEEDSSCPAFPSQRSWYYTSTTLNEMEQGLLPQKLGWKIIGGYIGESYARDFKMHYAIGEGMPNIKSILNGKMPQLADDATYQQKAYVLSCCASMWKMMFVDKSTPEQVLFDSFTNVVDWAQNNFSLQGTDRDNITAFGKSVLDFLQGENRQELTGRSGFRLRLIKQAKGAAKLIMDWNNVKAEAGNMF